MIQAGIVGATGYVGAELVRLLNRHPEIRISTLVSQSHAGCAMDSIYPSLKGSDQPMLSGVELSELAEASDVIFLALPHGTAADTVAALMPYGKKIIDLSADFRYRDRAVYEAWYPVVHPCPDLLKDAVYGMPELYRQRIAQAQIVGNPGCYTTCAILALAPLVKNKLIDPSTLVIDAKSGVTGAGRGIKAEMQFCEVNENFKAYGVATHRHTSEIEQELGLLAGHSLTVSFTPHLMPIQRGILSTGYARLTSPVSHAEIMSLYEQMYRDAPFVILRDEGDLPEIKHVRGSNYIHIGFVIDPRTQRIIVVSALDNLIKGAAGQAIQNMNLMFGLDESTGLNTPAWYL